MGTCDHGRTADFCTECHWRAAVSWAYQRSSEALMMPPDKPREARAAREQALCDINKRLGALIR